MGDRYYDSRNGRFLSQDLVSYPICLDLYAYANGDPINYFDPDGRFSSSIYQPIKATVLNVWNNPQFQGSLQMAGGFAEMSIGAGLAWTPFAPLGAAMLIHGADHFATGSYTFCTGRQRQTLSERLLQTAGMTPGQAAFSNNLLSMGASFAALGLRNYFIYTTNQAMAQSAMSSSSSKILPNFQSTLYRAVQPQELADIQKTGIFRNLGDAEGKYFTTSIEAASSYAKKAVKGFGDPPYTLIKTQVPNNILEGMPVLVDGDMPAWAGRLHEKFIDK